MDGKTDLGAWKGKIVWKFSYKLPSAFCIQSWRYTRHIKGGRQLLIMNPDSSFMYLYFVFCSVTPTSWCSQTRFPTNAWSSCKHLTSCHWSEKHTGPKSNNNRANLLNCTCVLRVYKTDLFRSANPLVYFKTSRMVIRRDFFVLKLCSAIRIHQAWGTSKVRGKRSMQE